MKSRFASLGRVHYFIRVTSTTIKEPKPEDSWAEAEVP